MLWALEILIDLLLIVILKVEIVSLIDIRQFCMLSIFFYRGEVKFISNLMLVIKSLQFKFLLH